MKCPRCGSEDFIIDEGIVVCTACLYTFNLYNSE